VLARRDDDDNLVIQVSDNGDGGAALLPGHGLAGLRDRVTAMDGKFTVDGTSGTKVTAILPSNSV